MADVKLGPSGSETTLPNVQWIAGNKPSFPVTTSKQIESKQMSDGNIRYAMFQTKRTFSLSWGYLSLAQLDVLRGLQALNQTLRFQDNNEDATWYNVIIVEFVHDPADSAIKQLGKYTCSLTLMEV